jgi:uncharacterized alkaline shock family protein YloU
VKTKLSGGTPTDERAQSKALLEALADQIGQAVAKVPGVFKIAGGGINRAGAKNPVKGIRLTVKEGALVVYVRLIALFGCPIPEIARQAQREVQDILSGSAQFPVSAVHVLVEEIHFDQRAADYRRQAFEALEEEKPAPLAISDGAAGG